MQDKHQPFVQLKEAVAESNTSAQKSLLGALVKLAPLSNKEKRAALCEGPLTLPHGKGATGRPRAVRASVKLVVLLVENGCADLVYLKLVRAMYHRSPTIRTVATRLCAFIVSGLGKDVFPIDDVSEPVGKEPMNLACACYKQIGRYV